MNDSQTAKHWIRMSFKGNKVWAQTDSSGNLNVKDKKVLIKYNLAQDYEYRVNYEKLRPEKEAVPSKKKFDKKKGVKKKSQKSPSPETGPDDENKRCIRIYTDGASSGNPGPAGIGIVYIHGENRKEISKFIGSTTNNVAELTAVKTALEGLKRKDLPVRIYSDSSYSIGLLTKGWKPQTNKGLVNETSALIKSFSDIKFIKVKGHAGIKGNEDADSLATLAIKKGLL